jgi:hypothetical protein
MNLKLLQLASPSLPVGAYSYSQGLEAAVEAGIVTDAASAEAWIGDVLELSVASMEAPVAAASHRAWRAGDLDAVRRWNEEFVASRETAELRAETLQMGFSLANLLRDLAVGDLAMEDAAYPAVYAYAVARWEVEAHEALSAYLFSVDREPGARRPQVRARSDRQGDNVCFSRSRSAFPPRWSAPLRSETTTCATSRRASRSARPATRPSTADCSARKGGEKK